MNNEIEGGIKNAVERGESLEKAKQSFLNAGYSLDDIQNAINSNPMPKQPNPPISPQVQQKPTPIPQLKINQTQYPSPPQQSQYAPLPSISPTPIKPQSSSLWIIILVVFCLLILIGAGLAGLYWDRISSFLGLA